MVYGGEYRDNLHQGILRAFTTDKGIFMFPIRFNLPVYFAASEDADAINTLESLTIWSENVSGNLVSGMNYDEALNLLYHYYPPEIILDKDRILLDKITEFLFLVKRFCDSENISEAIEDLLGMNKLSKNKAVASLFLKEALSYDVQKKDSFSSMLGFPVNRLVLEELREYDLSHVTTGGSNKENKSYKSRYYNQEEASKIVDMIDEVDKCWALDQIIIKTIMEEAIPYLKGTKELNSVAEMIKNRLELYLYEKN